MNGRAAALGRRSTITTALIAALALVAFALWPPSASSEAATAVSSAPSLNRPTASTSTAPAGADPGTLDPSTLLVRFHGGTEAARAALHRHGLPAGRPITGTDWVEVRVPREALGAQQRQLVQDPAVAAVERNRVRQAMAVPNDPAYALESSYLDTVRMAPAWDVARGAASITIAVVDTGVAAGHEDLAGRVLPGWDFLDGDSDASDETGHGTRVAGVAAASTDNGRGIAGAAWNARVLPVRVLSSTGGTDATIASGITWAADHGASIINLSLGGPGSTEVLRQAVAYAVAKDVVVIAAAGNSGGPVVTYPAAYPGVLAVGATDHGGRLVSFSQTGSWVDLAAPGVDLAVTDRAGGYAIASGTSFSSPLAAGVAALVRAQRPTWSAAEVLAQLKASAHDAGPPGDDPSFGAGVLDAAAAVGALPVQPPVVAPADTEAGATRDNADPAHAEPLGTGTVTRAISVEQDVDWYRLQPGLVAERVTVTVTPPPVNGLYDLDAILAVFDADLDLIELRNGSTTGPETRTFDMDTNGAYVAVLNVFGSAASGNYSLTVARTSAPLTPATAGAAGRLALLGTTPPDLAVDVATSTTPSVTFARAVRPASLTSASVRLVHGRTGEVIPATLTVSGSGEPGTRVSLTPTTALAPGTAYHLVLAGVEAADGGDLSGVAARFRTAGTTPAVALPAPPPTPPEPTSTTTTSTTTTTATVRPTTTTTSRPAPAPTPPAPAPAPAPRSGYWMVGQDGAVYAFGDARHVGAPSGFRNGMEAVDLEPTPSLDGYWVVTNTGHVYAFGDAPYLGGVNGAVAFGEAVTSISATPSGRGYWLFTTKGRVIPFGDAPFLGDMAATRLNGPVLDSIPTPSGRGYYMVASDGGIFTFGDAVFRGSMGDAKLNAPVQSLVPDRDGVGYWLVASDGGIFSFEAAFRGSMGSVRLNGPITGMVRFGDGYLMVGTDGGIFDFSDRDFYGSLGDHPPPAPIVAVAVAER